MTGSGEPSADEGALAGVVVLDLTTRLAGSSAAFTLAQLGATVIFVDSNSDRNDARLIDGTTGEQAARAAWRANQKAIDIGADGAHVRSLAYSANIVLSDDELSAHAKGLDYESLRQINGAVIYGSLRSWASNALFGERTSETMLQAITGMMASTGYPDGPPVRTGPDYVAILSGVHLATGVIAALLAQGSTEHVRVAEQEVAMNVAASMFNDSTLDLAHLRHAHGTGSDSSFCNLFPTAPFGPDDWCAVLIPSDADRSWRSLWAAIGRDDLTTDPRFATTDARKRNLGLVAELVAPWLASRSKHEATDILGDAGVAAAALRSVDEVLSLDLEGSGIPAWPARMSRSRVEMAPASAWAGLHR